ncbi:tetratricopeptide repeat protein [Flexivirga sp. B27]
MSEESASETAPQPDVVTSLDDIADSLGRLREWAGLPSYGQLASRVRAARLARGVPAAEAAIGRVTVYDCFRAGRRRIDVDLVVEIARALGASDRQAVVWRNATRRAMSPATSLRSVPADVTLPPAPDPFVGREGQVATMLGTRRAVLVDGMPGSGKSALALTVAHELLRSGTVQVGLYADLLGAASDPADPRAVLHGFLRALGVEASGGDLHAQFVSALADHAAVVVLDNAASAEQLLPLMPPAEAMQDARVIVTSRHSLSLPDVEHITVAELDDVAAADLLAALTGRTAAASDAPPLAELASLAGGIPLALTIIANRIRTHQDWSLDEHVTAYRERLDLLHLDADIEGALAIELDALDADPRRGFLLSALHPGTDFSTAAAAAMLGTDGVVAGRLLAGLASHHLVREAGPERWAMHDLVRAFGDRHAIAELSPSVRRTAMHRVLTDYLDTCTRAVATLTPHAVADWHWLQNRVTPMAADEARAWFDRELHNIAGAVAWAATGEPAGAVRLAAVASWPLWERADLDLTTSMHRTAVQAAASLADDRSIALTCRLLGLTMIRAARFADAAPQLERSAQLYRDLGDPRGEVAALNGSAIIATLTGRYDEALPLLRRIVDFYEEQPPTAENADRLSVGLGNLAVALSRSGDHAGAVECLQRSLDLAVAHGWAGRELTAISNMSELLCTEGKFDEAEVAARKALRMSRELGDEIVEIYATTNLAIALSGCGRSAEADRVSREAVALARAADAPDTLAAVLNNHAELLAAAGDPSARDYFTEALEIATEIGEELEMQRAGEGLGEGA